MEHIRRKIVILFVVAISTSLLGYILYGACFSSKAHMMSYEDKIERLSELAEHSERKAVFVGGSGTHFGIKAEKFEKECHLKSVNMGLHASISMNTYLSAVDPYLKDGDCLFIIPEYDYYCTEWIKTSKQNVEFAVFYNKNIVGFLKNRPFEALENLLYVGWGLNADCIKQVISLMISGRTTDAYNRTDSNCYGDFVGYRSNHSFTNVFASFNQTNNDAFLHLLTYVNKFEHRGIRVYILFPPYAEFAYNGNNHVINEIHDYLKKHRMRLLFNPKDSVYEEKLFYDTVYHLNEEGRNVYTDLVIRKFQQEHE